MIVRQAGLFFVEFRLSPHGRRTMALLTLFMAGLVGASAALWFLQMGHWALTVAGVPLLLVGGGYGLFLGAMLAFGRKGRWN